MGELLVGDLLLGALLVGALLVGELLVGGLLVGALLVGELLMCVELDLKVGRVKWEVANSVVCLSTQNIMERMHIVRIKHFLFVSMSNIRVTSRKNEITLEACGV